MHVFLLFSHRLSQMRPDTISECLFFLQRLRKLYASLSQCSAMISVDMIYRSNVCLTWREVHRIRTRMYNVVSWRKSFFSLFARVSCTKESISASCSAQSPHYHYAVDYAPPSPQTTTCYAAAHQVRRTIFLILQTGSVEHFRTSWEL